MDRERYFIHVDGALFAQILPHLDGAAGQVPVHDFTRPISSLSVSGHKMMGCPMPSGVIVHRKNNIKASRGEGFVRAFCSILSAED